MCRYAFLQEMLIWSLNLFWTLAKIILCNSDETGFQSHCPSLMLGIAIRCIQHSQAMLEPRVCDLAYSFFHFTMYSYTCTSVSQLGGPFFMKHKCPSGAKFKRIAYKQWIIHSQVETTEQSLVIIKQMVNKILRRLSDMKTSSLTLTSWPI